MGIRYYAYPVPPELVEQAHDDPRLFLSHDPLMDAWGPEDERPVMLYLDKVWGPLQQLLARRRALDLVAGHVRWIGYEYEPYVAVLDPDEVAAIADDLVLVDDVDDDIAARLGPLDWSAETINRYLAEARAFTRSLADRGCGLVYAIG